MSKKSILISAMGLITLLIVVSIILSTNNPPLSNDSITLNDISGNNKADNISVSGNDMTNDTPSVMDLLEKDVIMPDICGMNIDDAIATLKANGVDYYDIVWSNDSDHPEEILQQGIAPGENVDITVPVIITVSSAETPETQGNLISVPELNGYTIDGATQTILESGLRVGGVTKAEQTNYPKGIDVGEILAQDPTAGTEVEAGTEITIYYRGE